MSFEFCVPSLKFRVPHLEGASAVVRDRRRPKSKVAAASSCEGSKVNTKVLLGTSKDRGNWPDGKACDYSCREAD